MKKSAHSEEVDHWIEQTEIYLLSKLINKEQKAIARILGEDFELQELWSEDGENEKWHLEMNDLLKRVSS